MWDPFFSIIVTGVVTGAIAWGGIHVELRYLRRDMDRLDSKVKGLEQQIRKHYPPAE